MARGQPRLSGEDWREPRATTVAGKICRNHAIGRTAPRQALSGQSGRPGLGALT